MCWLFGGYAFPVCLILSIWLPLYKWIRDIRNTNCHHLWMLQSYSINITNIQYARRMFISRVYVFWALHNYFTPITNSGRRKPKGILNRQWTIDIQSYSGKSESDKTLTDFLVRTSFCLETFVTTKHYITSEESTLSEMFSKIADICHNWTLLVQLTTVSPLHAVD